MKGRFKDKANKILKPSMGDFIGDTEKPSSTNTEIRKSANTVERLNIQIEKAIYDRMVDHITLLKKDPSVKKRDASQRKIVEQALDAYLQN